MVQFSLFTSLVVFSIWFALCECLLVTTIVFDSHRIYIRTHTAHTAHCWINFDNFLRIQLNEFNDAIWFLYVGVRVCVRVFLSFFWSFFLLLRFVPFFHSFELSHTLCSVYWIQRIDDDSDIYRFRELVALFVRACARAADWWCCCCCCHRHRCCLTA